MPGAQVIELVLSWVVTSTLTFAVVIFDERRLSEERLERAWPRASRDLALVYFGVLAIPFHFARTRGTWTSVRGIGGRILGFGAGVVVAAVVLLSSALLITALAWVLGLPDVD
ncbi:MAG: hypothetical protein BGO98_40660 [Myxococcales bacterium 68-20]|nr:MAG: hypothetical protein BGO98_40660 [Myxococcales bacterium 68-20]